MKISHGCWTCRLRRKKCDEKKPDCATCATLDIKCHYQLDDKPEWMDGGRKQAEMSEQVKREIKVKASRRREQSMFQIPSWSTTTTTSLNLPRKVPTDLVPDLDPNITSDVVEKEPSSQVSMVWLREGIHGEDYNHYTYESRPLEGSDAALSLFYLEKVLPFLFPFYNPSLPEGGKAWILEMIMRRPAVRQAILCQGVYFSLACGRAVGDSNWEEVLTQSRSAFWTLRESLKVIDNLDIGQSLACTVRVITSIMQIHRFEITVLNHGNWQAHLNAVVDLFQKLLEGDSSFNATFNRLGPPIFPIQQARLPTAEQAAFRFSSALVIFDDIIASTTLKTRARLYDRHRSLLCSDIEGVQPPVDIESVFGIENWALLQIGEITALDAWKVECRTTGCLDVMELACRATIIKDTLIAHLNEVESNATNDRIDPLDALLPSNPRPSHKSLITRIWAQAALLYLFIVTSGWQPANDSVRYRVSHILELLKQISPPTLLRSVVWPFCVAGCLAEPVQEIRFREIVCGLKVPNLFGNIYKALDIMENTWKIRNSPDIATRDLSVCFGSLEDPVLLV